MAIVSCSWITGCAQPRTAGPKDPEEMSVIFRHVAQRGGTAKSYIALSDIPNSPGLPAPYRLIENKGYKLVTDTIDLGDPIVSFKVVVNSEQEFKQVRVLRLIANEMRSQGYEWEDCTMSIDSLRVFEPNSTRPEFAEHLRGYKEQNARYLPDFAGRRVSCEVRDGLKRDNYFLVVKQVDPPPAKPLTGLKFALDSALSSETGVVTYTISFRNSGPKAIGDLSVRSSFDVDLGLMSAEPSAGNCVRSDWGNLGGTTICHLGPLPAGETITVILKGEPTGNSRTVVPGRLNVGWQIDAVVAERPNDPVWGVNYFQFNPMTK